MDRQFYKKCIEYEVYRGSDSSINKVSLFRKFWNKHYCPQTNSVYLIRKMQYYYSLAKKGAFYKGFLLLSHLIRIKLMRRYSIDIQGDCSIDIGLRIMHPIAIVIGKSTTIGKNFQVFQQCTVGLAHRNNANDEDYPKLGDNITMYVNSSIFGPGTLCDNVIVGANSIIIGDVNTSGTYVGVPASLIKKGEK